MSNKDYENIITILVREILKKRLAIFVGAGVSMNVGLPSWKQLLENLIKKYAISTKENNILRLASRIERSIGRSNFVDEISDTFRTSQKPSTPIHKLLSELDVNLYITTNYDHLLEEAFRQKGIHPHVVSNDQDLANFNSTAKTIVKLHGDIDSPNSLVITEKDYRQYRIDHRGFIEWVKTKDAELTFLFLGTSFEDPRLVETDDHVVELFGENRRNHVIVLKKPEKSDAQDLNDFQAELEDFEDKCRSFESERSFLVLVIQQYDEIEMLLQEIKNRVLQAQIDEKKGSDRDTALYGLQMDRYETLDKKFSDHVDATVRELCDGIVGPGYFPSFSKVKNKIELLIERLQNPPHILSPETIVHGYLTLIDAFAATGRPEDISKALEFYEKANSELSDINERHELALRMLRAKAKLLFLQGDFQFALEIIQNDKSPKGIFWHLAILLTSGKLDEAFSLIQDHAPIQPEWAGEAIRVLVQKGDLEAAEAIYEEFTSKPDSFQDPNVFIRLQHQMALAYLRRSILLEGNPDFFQIIPGQLSQNATAACKKALHYLDEMHKAHQYTDPNESLVFAESLITKMQALDLLGETSQALDVAKRLLHFRPIPQAVAAFVASRENRDNKDTILTLVEMLSLDHPKEDWAWVMRIKLLALAGQFKEAWDLLFLAKSHILSEEERKDLARIALELGFAIERIEEAWAVVEDLVDQGDLFYQFLFAKNLLYQEKFDAAYEIFQGLDKLSFPPSVQSEILSLMAKIHIKRGQWPTAKDLLKLSVSKYNHPLSLRELIYVGFHEKDDVIALEAATTLEKLGFDDEETEQAKAQAAFNLGRYDQAIETWDAVYRRDKTPQTAIKLATAHRAKGEYDEALTILRAHIPDDATPDYECLGLYCAILVFSGKLEDAFHQLDIHFEEIISRPELLAMHLDLAYRVNKEDRAHQSLLRLIELQKEGKVQPGLFRPGNIDEFKEIVEGARQREEFAIEQYRLGRVPRILLCEIKNRPYYLDWAIRTQPMPLSDDPRIRLEYTVYSTNSLRIGLRGGKNDFVPIMMPAEAQEAVIDLSALITLHQLNLFPLIEKRFKAIYYPQAFYWLWESEKTRYTFPQRSKAILYREIDRLLKIGKITKIELGLEHNAENDPRRLLKLGSLEGLLIITAWSKEEDWYGADEGVVIWMPKLVSWLYKSGKISEDKYRESLSLLKGPPGLEEHDQSKPFQPAGRLLFDKGAIEFLVENYLLDPLFSMGVRPVLENWDAQYFQHLETELDLLEDVGKWQHDIEAAIKASKVFHLFTHPLFENRSGYYSDYIETTLKFCKERKMSLMADDRTLQMVSESDWKGHQFGTDALLIDLFEQDMLSLEQYTSCFLKLVRWRYRFLIPDVRLLLYLAKQYKHRPLGSELEEIADYGRHCMEDPGLFFGPEATDPPKPLGAVFYMKWLDQWIKMLCSIWIDEEFDQDSRLSITRKVFGHTIPPSPKGLPPEIRDRLGASEEIKVLSSIIQFIMESEESLKLSGLLREAFFYYGITNERQAGILRDGFQLLVRISLSDDFRQQFVSDPKARKELAERDLTYEEYIKNNILKKNLARMLVAYYGSKSIRTPCPFSDLMYEYGLGDRKKIENSDTETEGEFAQSGVLSPGNQMPIERGDISISAVDGSIFKIAWPGERREEVTLLPEMLNHTNTRIRMEAFQLLMAPDQLTEPSRIKLEGLKELLASEIKAQWEPAAYRARQAVMKDFHFARMHLKTTLLNQISDKSMIADAINNLLFPDIATAWSETPAVVKSPEQKSDVFKENSIADFKQTQKEGGNQTENALNQYMRLFGFVALTPPLDAWSLIKEMLITPTASDQAAREFCETVSHWAYALDDPLALVIAWQVLLGAGGNAESIAYFKSNDFKKKLGRLFIDLAAPGYRTGNPIENGGGPRKMDSLNMGISSE